MTTGTLDFASIVTLICTTIPAVYKLLHPFITEKVATEKNRQVQQCLQIADNLAISAVAAMANYAALSKSERKDHAVTYVLRHMASTAGNISEDVVADKVELAYQKYKHTTAGDNHTNQTVIDIAADSDPSTFTEVQ
ncbi:hypothetical protein [Secundilactobacillus folii]|uniref:Uncharacterized protein n=1 Tax=Secundilactobacillus folii TaxID=2678357 RepID=A0A7X3C432_9LACO|nr:hypothetical protein [Secundilactobacillus folii]MTV83191.1 hypothetical protein [Secundilactobacillus folii]